MESAKTVLIVGGSGFIGTHLALRLRSEYKVFATYHSSPIQIPGVTCLPLDLRDPDWTKRAVYTASPDILIYAAGSNNVQRAEMGPKDAERLHVSYLGPVLKAATLFQPKVIYLSNCYVFDGVRGNYHETDTVLAASALGRLKVSAENFVRGRALNYSILRLSPVFGRGNGQNACFIDPLRVSLSRGQKVSIGDTEIHSFAPVGSTVEFIVRAIESAPRNKVLHYGGITKCSRPDFARAFAKRFKFDPALIVAATPSARGMQSSAIPYDFSLNSSESIRQLGIKPMLLDEGFDELERGANASA